MINNNQLMWKIDDQFMVQKVVFFNYHRLSRGIIKLLPLIIINCYQF